jgi:polyhydroxybutyrate depolymerase
MRSGWVVVGLLAVACGPAGGGEADDTAGSHATAGEASTGASASGEPPADASTGHPGGTGTSGEASTSFGDAGDATTGARPVCLLDAPFPAPMAEHVLVYDDIERSYVVYVPASYDHEAFTPLVLAFHGYANSPGQQEEWSALSEKAAAAGFVLVYPRGTGFISGWNGGDCCGSMVDDVGFVSALIDRLQEDLCIDPQRVYATGFSNGGFLSHRLACELSDRIAAIASVAGVMGIDDCTPTRPVPVLQMHGTGDLVVPYGGSTLLGFESVPETIAAWVARDGCEGEPVVSYQHEEVTCERHERCEAGVEVELCTVEGGGHTWPGGADIFGAGPTTQNLAANDRLWDFFVAHPL